MHNGGLEGPLGNVDLDSLSIMELKVISFEVTQVSLSKICWRLGSFRLYILASL